MKKLFIGKLAFSTTEADLRAIFSDYEPLASLKIISDRDTGRSRGFGFIEIEDSSKADEAIQALDGATVDGATLVVNEARPAGTQGGRMGDRRPSFDSRKRSNYAGRGGYENNRRY